MSHVNKRLACLLLAIETEWLNSVIQATSLGIFSYKCVDQSVPSSGRRKKIRNQNELFFKKIWISALFTLKKFRIERYSFQSPEQPDLPLRLVQLRAGAELGSEVEQEVG